MKRMNRQSGLTTIKFLGLIFLLFVAVLLGTAFALAIVIDPPFRISDPTVINTPAATTPATPEAPPTLKYDPNAVVTRGNNSWIPLNLYDDKARSVLEVLDAYEKAHPELEIVSWTLQMSSISDGAHNYIYGIWVHHRKR